MPGGKRKVTQISEVAGYDFERKRITIIDIFNYRNGESLQPTGYLPTFIDSLIAKGLLSLEFLYGQDHSLEDKTPNMIEMKVN